jgi:hypothetical protein
MSVSKKVSRELYAARPHNYNEIYQGLAGDPENPYQTGRLEIRLGWWAVHNESGISSKICPRLTRGWAWLQCTTWPAEYPSFLEDLPRRFTLVNRTLLSQIRGSGSGAGADRQLQLLKMELKPEMPEVVCNESREFCTAAVAFDQSLIAVWSVWDNPQSATDKAENLGSRNAIALQNLLDNAIGEIENFGAFKTPCHPLRFCRKLKPYKSAVQ